MKTDFQNGTRLFAEDLNSNFEETQQASNVLSGEFDAARIPNLDASKIASGTISADRLPDTGKVLQVVTASNTSSTTLSDSWQNLGISATITPTSASSTLIVEWNGIIGAGNNGSGTISAFARVLDADDTVFQTVTSSQGDGTSDHSFNDVVFMRAIVSYGDTNARTFRVQGRKAGYNGTASNRNLVVWEIAG